jgi:hypothetical protein
MNGSDRTASAIPLVSQAEGGMEGHALPPAERTGRYRRVSERDFGQNSRIGQFVTRDFRQ